jgi:hypothetical protein
MRPFGPKARSQGNTRSSYRTASARFLTLLFALQVAMASSPAHGQAFGGCGGAICLAALNGGQTTYRADHTHDGTKGNWLLDLDDLPLYSDRDALG